MHKSHYLSWTGLQSITNPKKVIQTFKLIKVSISPNLHVFELWEESGTTRDKH